MKVLVTGAHGFIGSHLTEKLVAEGVTVRALVSPWGKLDNLHKVQTRVQTRLHDRLELVRADLTEADSLRGVCQDIDLVYHAAGRVADYGPAKPFFETNVRGTENVWREAERAGVRRGVLVSSVAVHRYTGFQDADPRALPLDGDLSAYARSKVEAEKLVRSSGLETVVVRPGLWPFGPRDPNFRQIARALRGGLFPLVDGGRAVINTAYVENLVVGLWLAGTVPEAAERTYLVADAGKPSWRELFTELARLLRAPPPRLSLPGWLSEPLGRTVEQAYRVTNAEPPLTRYRGALMRRDVHLSLAAAEEELEYQPAVTWQEGLARTVAALDEDDD